MSRGKAIFECNRFLYRPRRGSHFWMGWLGIFLLLNPLPVLAAGGGNAQEKKKDDSKKEAARAAKEEREYRKIKAFADDLLAKDPEFRQEVNVLFRLKQKEHSEYARSLNVGQPVNERLMAAQMKQAAGDFNYQWMLYDNSLAQNYVNRVGQSLVPADSTNLFAFRITLSPIPEARSLSTGSVYVTTGLLAEVDNEAQLAYILGHEIAHVERNHWGQDVLVACALQRYNEKQQQKRNWINLAANLTAGFIPGVGGLTSFQGNMLFVAIPELAKLAVPNASVTWDKAQEDEADKFAVKYMLARNYDPREVPKFYENLKRLAQLDKRVESGNTASLKRMEERLEGVNSVLALSGGDLRTSLTFGALNLQSSRLTDAEIKKWSLRVNGPPPDLGKSLGLTADAQRRITATQALIQGELASDVKARLDSGELIGNSAEFAAVMSAIRRDNGNSAFEYDMFAAARRNLEESIAIRSDDALTYFYLGRVLMLTGRTATEKRQATEAFTAAIQYDGRKVLPEAYFLRAVSLIESSPGPGQKDDVAKYLKEYVEIYQRQNGGALPSNMRAVYQYLKENGNDETWTATPTVTVATLPSPPPKAEPVPENPQPQPAPSDPRTRKPKKRP